MNPFKTGQVASGLIFFLGAAVGLQMFVRADEPSNQPPPKESATAEENGQEDESPEEKEEKVLKHFMRKKLDESSKILEGLAMEDFRLIREGAESLYKMSTVEKWRKSNDALYRQFSSEFQRTTQDLMDAADEGKIDKSALKWMDVTLKCIECHRYVREVLVLDNSSPQ